MVKSLVTPTLGERIREARKAAGFSADELAHRLGLTANTVYRWEQGRNTPTVAKLRLVAAATERPLTFFLEEVAA